MAKKQTPKNPSRDAKTGKYTHSKESGKHPETSAKGKDKSKEKGGTDHTGPRKK